MATTTKMNDTQIRECDRLLRERKLTMREIGERFGVSHATIGRRARKIGLDTYRPSRPASERARNAPTLQPGQEGAPLAPPLLRARKGGATHSLLTPRLRGADLDRQVAEAIAAGVGRRYEWRNPGGRKMVIGTDGAMSYLRAQGMEIEVRRKAGRGSARDMVVYQVTKGGERQHRRAWITGAELVEWAGTMEREQSFREVPIRDCVASDISGRDKGGDKGGLIQYHQHASRTVAR